MKRPLLLLSFFLIAATSPKPFANGVTPEGVKSFFGVVIPSGSSLDTAVDTVDEFFDDTLFPAGDTRCVAAKTGLSAPEHSKVHEYDEYTSEAYVLARQGASNYTVLRYWVAGSAKGRKSKKAALTKLQIFHVKLSNALVAAPACR